jgi:hypothetical protein
LKQYPFCRNFLGFEESITVWDLNFWLKSDKMLPKSIGVLHSKILSLIIRDGETPDEERLLDDDTWPEVMRQVIVTQLCILSSLSFSEFLQSQHLEDTYGELEDYARLIEQLTSKEYCEIEPHLRLQALVTLVNDCLQTKTLR